jgi:ferredoxin/flavodoxin---NADP+ reductase
MPSPGDEFYRARVVQRRIISDSILVVQVDPGGHFPFVPGQYATLGVITPEKHYERAYSIVSPPHEKFVEFFIELVPHGDLTPRLFSHRVGDEFTLRKGAKGRFTLDTTSGRTNHLLIATVTGVAPFISYVRCLYRPWEDAKFVGERKLFLLEGASQSWELGYAEELRQLSDKVPWFSFASTISRPWDDASWKGERGRVDELVRKCADHWQLAPASTTAYLCGHPSLVANVKGILHRRGWQKSSIKEELYFIPTNKTAQTAWPLSRSCSLVPRRIDLQVQERSENLTSSQHHTLLTALTFCFSPLDAFQMVEYETRDSPCLRGVPALLETKHLPAIGTSFKQSVGPYSGN